MVRKAPNRVRIRNPLSGKHRAPQADVRAAVDSNARSKLIFRASDPDDARDMARQSRVLEAIDFLSLPQYQAYANLTSQGAPAGWCIVKTLPPPEPTGLGEVIRRASRDHFGQPLPPAVKPDPPAGSAGSEQPIGRKRRTP